MRRARSKSRSATRSLGIFATYRLGRWAAEGRAGHTGTKEKAGSKDAECSIGCWSSCPIAAGLHYLRPDCCIHGFSFRAAIAIIPLAGWLGRATEHIAEKTGEGIGGLLNATFGNAAEMIIAIMAMQRGLHDVVKASLTGSIIGNILLVMGAAMLAGGMKFKTQKFNVAGGPRRSRRC